MKKLALAISLTAMALPSPSDASPDADAVKTFIKAVKSNADLRANYPDAVSIREAASLRRVQKCDATNLMKQKADEFTVVWVCGGGALGMRVTVADGKVALVSTFEVERRPN